MLFVVGQLEAGVAEDLDAVVAIGIVRGGNHDAGGEAIGAREIGDAGRGDDTGEAYVDAAAQESAGDLRGDPRTGLARIHADNHPGAGRDAAEVRAQGHAERMDGSRVERILARQAANAVGAEELFGHLLFAVFAAAFTNRNFDCNACRILKAHAGVADIGVDVILGDARRGLQIDGVGLDTIHAGDAAGGTDDGQGGRLGGDLHDLQMRRQTGRKAHFDGHATRVAALEIQADLGRNGADQLNAARQTDVSAARW